MNVASLKKRRRQVANTFRVSLADTLPDDEYAKVLYLIASGGKQSAAAVSIILQWKLTDIYALYLLLNTSDTTKTYFKDHQIWLKRLKKTTWYQDGSADKIRRPFNPLWVLLTFKVIDDLHNYEGRTAIFKKPLPGTFGLMESNAIILENSANIPGAFDGVGAEDGGTYTLIRVNADGTRVSSGEKEYYHWDESLDSDYVKEVYRVFKAGYLLEYIGGSTVYEGGIGNKCFVCSNMNSGYQCPQSGYRFCSEKCHYKVCE